MSRYKGMPQPSHAMRDIMDMRRVTVATLREARSGTRVTVGVDVYVKLAPHTHCPWRLEGARQWVNSALLWAQWARGQGSLGQGESEG